MVRLIAAPFVAVSLIALFLSSSSFSEVGSETGTSRVSAPDERAFSAFSDDRSRRFDFWIGAWDVNLRIQQDDLSFKDSIAARAHIYKILKGKAILELWDSVPIKGYSLRYFDPERDEWVLWLNWPGPNRSGTSSLSGSFRHGRGDFYSSFQRPDGQTIKQRYSFNDITPFSLRWDDLRSADGGKTWSKDWVMEFTRTSIDPTWPIDRQAVPTFENGDRCNSESFRPYEVLARSWSSSEGRFDAYRVLDGCAVLGFLTHGQQETFLFLTYSTSDSVWELSVLDDQAATSLQRFRSSESWNRLESENGSSFRFDVTAESLSVAIDGKRMDFEPEQ